MKYSTGNSSTNLTVEIYTSQYYQSMMHAAETIEMYYIWVIFFIGFPGNIATILTITRIKPVTSLTCYVALLAIVDNLTLLVKLSHLILQDYGVKVMTSAECKILSFLGNVLVNYASWILVVIAVERFVAVWFPLKLGLNWPRRKSITVMTSVLFTLTAVYLHLLWTMTSYDGFCAISEVYHNYFITNIWYWVNSSLYAFIPCCLLFFFNILIIVGIRRSADQHRHLTSSPRTTTHRDVTIMLLVVSFVFLVLSTPICMFLLIGQSWRPNYYSDDTALKTMLRQIAFVCCDSNHAINFFLYFLSAKRFRRQFFHCNTSSTSETVLLRNRSYMYTNKFNSPGGTRVYEDTDSLTQIKLYTKSSS